MKTCLMSPGLHEELKKECKKRGLKLQNVIDQMTINQLDKWMKEKEVRVKL